MIHCAPKRLVASFAARRAIHTVTDLRSDTVTRPTKGMLRAATEAPLGDDGELSSPNQIPFKVCNHPLIIFQSWERTRP